MENILQQLEKRREEARLGGGKKRVEAEQTPLETGNIICSNNQETVFKKFSEIIRSSIH